MTRSRIRRSLVGAVENIEEKLEADETMLQMLIEENESLLEKIDNLEGDSDSLQIQIDNNEKLIALLQLEIETINGELALKQDLINGTCPDGTAIQADGTVVYEIVVDSVIRT